MGKYLVVIIESGYVGVYTRLKINEIFEDSKKAIYDINNYKINSAFKKHNE